MACKGLCDRLKTKKPFTGRYIAGQKRCGVCDIFFETKLKLCPCCHSILRTRPKLSWAKSRLRRTVIRDKEEKIKKILKSIDSYANKIHGSDLEKTTKKTRIRNKFSRSHERILNIIHDGEMGYSKKEIGELEIELEKMLKNKSTKQIKKKFGFSGYVEVIAVPKS